MHAVVLDEPGRLEDIALPEPGPPRAGEALVAVRRVGICGTDFHAYVGDQNFFVYPRILGHELAVEVLAVGPGPGEDRWQIGDQCAVLPYISCGACRPCQSGRANCCERIDVLGVTIDGGLCERLLVPTTALYGRPGLALDQLALVETLGIGMHAVQRASPGRGNTALILGMGPVGLAVAQCLAGRVETIFASDLSADRLAFAGKTVSVDTVAAGEDLVRQVVERGDGDLPTLVFDATGSRESMERAFELTGPGGRLVLVGHTVGVIEFDNPLFHRRELDIRASRNALATEWDEVLDLMVESALDPVPWISHRPTLDSIRADLPNLMNDERLLVKAMVELDAGGI